MSSMPPPAPYSASYDEDRLRSHFRTMSVLWYVYGALEVLCGLGTAAYGFFVQFMMDAVSRDMQAQMAGPQAAAQQPGQVPPVTPLPGPPIHVMETMGTVYLAIALGGAAFALFHALFSFLTARALSVPRSRGICIATAGIACLSIPLGTVLGIFTLIALLKPEAERLFAEGDRRLL